MSEPSDRLLRIRIRDIPTCLSEKAIIECIALQNHSVWGDLKADDIRKSLKAIFKVGPRRPDLVDWVIDAEPVVFAALKKSRTVYIEWGACRLKEYSSVLLCH